mgnify:CR=1 FL=1
MTNENEKIIWDPQTVTERLADFLNKCIAKWWKPYWLNFIKVEENLWYFFLYPNVQPYSVNDLLTKNSKIMEFVAWKKYDYYKWYMEEEIIKAYWEVWLHYFSMSMKEIIQKLDYFLENAMLPSD